jgi:hypothetical protein
MKHGTVLAVPMELVARLQAATPAPKGP